MRIGVLGPVTAECDGAAVDLGPLKQRRLLATLAMHRGRSLSIAAIAEAMWGDEPPASHVVVLQGYISGLRKALEPTRGPRQSGRTIVTTSTGYMLELEPGALDVDRFEAAVRDAERVFRTAPGAPWLPLEPPSREEARRACDALDAALALWRGEPYAELGDALSAQGDRASLEELRVHAQELRAAIGIAIGASADAFGRLEALGAANRHRENPAMLKAVALTNLGRQVDALASLRQWREDLLEEQGLDPSPAVRELEAAILQRRLETVELAAPAGSAPGPGGPASGGSAPAGSGPGLGAPIAARDGSAPGPGRSAPGQENGAGPEAFAELRVGIVDDHPVFRMGLRGLLASIPGFRVVVDADGPDAAREQVDAEVDVLLMDLDLAGHSGIDLTRELLGGFEGLRVLVMTMHDEDEWVSQAVAAGAHGYLIKSAQSDEIERAIRTVAHGGFVLDRGAAGAVRDALARSTAGGGSAP